MPRTPPDTQDSIDDRSGLRFCAGILQVLTLSVWAISLPNSSLGGALRSLVVAIASVWVAYFFSKRLAKTPLQRILSLVITFPLSLIFFLLVWIVLSPDLKGLRH